MPAVSGGIENEPSAAVMVCVVSKLLRFSAITSAFATGRAELVTLPRIWRTDGRATTSGCAGAETTTAMMAPKATPRNRRIAGPRLHPFPSRIAYARTLSRSRALTITLQRLFLVVSGCAWFVVGSWWLVAGAFGAEAPATNYQPLTTFTSHVMHAQQIRLRSLIQRRSHQDHEPVAGGNEVAGEQIVVDAVDDLFVILARVFHDERLHAPEDVH